VKLFLDNFFVLSDTDVSPQLHGFLCGLIAFLVSKNSCNNPVGKVMDGWSNIACLKYLYSRKLNVVALQ